MSDFLKYQALGNDYLIVDPGSTDLVPTPALVRLLCDRHYGIGSDGVLFGPVGPVASAEPIGLRIFNPDGGECERSGNGLRIFGLYLAEHYLKDDEFTVRTPAGDARVEILDAEAGLIKVDMGRPCFEADQVPVEGLSGPAVGWSLALGDRTFTVTSVNVGNPHTVVPLPQVGAELARDLGPRIARHPRFPHGTNVQFLQVIERTRIRIEIWERGAGYTLASGSSSCAAAAAARALDLVDDEVEVQMPGGSLRISFDPAGSIQLTGTAEPVAGGWFAPGFRARLLAAGRTGAAG